MTPGTRARIRRQPYSSDRDTVLATLERVKVGKVVTTYTWHIEGKQHWRVLSQFDSKQIVEIVSEPLAGKLAA